MIRRLTGANINIKKTHEMVYSVLVANKIETFRSMQLGDVSGYAAVKRSDHRHSCYGM